MAAWVSPALIVVTWQPLHSFKLLLLPLKTCPIHKNALALAVEQSGSEAGTAKGNVQNPFGERRQSAVKALRARETGAQAGTPTMNEASKAVGRSWGELGPVAATNIAQDYAMCAYLHASHTCTCIHPPLSFFLSFCVCARVCAES